MSEKNPEKIQQKSSNNLAKKFCPLKSMQNAMIHRIFICDEIPTF